MQYKDIIMCLEVVHLYLVALVVKNISSSLAGGDGAAVFYRCASNKVKTEETESGVFFMAFNYDKINALKRGT